MARPITASIGDPKRDRSQLDSFVQPASDSSSAVSWASVFAGAAGAASLSLILLMLGTGLGLSSVSPWAHHGISKTTFGVTTILWVTFTQLVASGLGGYLAGRLRTRWVEVHRDEVYFRDTVHGFLSWAVSSLLTAALLTSVMASITNSNAQSEASATGHTTTGLTAMAGSTKSDVGTGSMDYLIDSLFRREATLALIATPLPRAEVGLIFTTNIHTRALPGQDVRYVGQLLTQHTGLSQQAAEKRVEETYARAQAQWSDTQTEAAQLADTARKASAYASLWLFIALLSGAFVASLAATAGGRQRDA